jgi:hypothetical protein
MKLHIRQVWENISEFDYLGEFETEIEYLKGKSEARVGLVDGNMLDQKISLYFLVMLEFSAINVENLR